MADTKYSATRSLVATCSLLVPMLMRELDSIATAKSEDVQGHIDEAKDILEKVSEGTQKAVEEIERENE